MNRTQKLLPLLLLLCSQGCTTSSPITLPAGIAYEEVDLSGSSRSYGFEAVNIHYPHRSVNPRNEGMATFSGNLYRTTGSTKRPQHFQFTGNVSKSRVVSGTDGEYYLIVPMIAE